MPSEIAEPPAAEPKDITLSVPLGDIFEKAMPGLPESSDEPAPELPVKPIKPQKQPARQPEPEQPTPEPEVTPETPEKTAAEPTPETKSISDLLFGEEKKPETPTESTVAEPVKDPTPPGMTGKTREHFEKQAEAKFQAEKRAIAAEKRIADLEKKQAEGDPGAKAKIKELETELSRYREVAQIANVEMDPEFQARVSIPRKQVVEMAKATFADAGGDPDLLESAFGLKGRARAERLDELLGEITSETLRAELRLAANQVKGFDLQRENIIKNREQFLKQREQQQQIAQHEAFQNQEKQVKASLEAAANVLRDEAGFEIFRRVDDPKFQWWNEENDKMRNVAEKIMTQVSDPKEMAIASWLAAAAPRYRILFQQEHQARVKAEKALAEYKGSEPGLGNGTNRNNRVGQGEDEDRPLDVAILDSIQKASGR